MRTRKPPPVPFTSDSVPTASTIPVNIASIQASGPSVSTRTGISCDSGTGIPSKNLAPCSPRTVGATITITRSTIPRLPRAACSAPPPSSSSVEMSHASKARTSVRKVAACPDTRLAPAACKAAARSGCCSTASAVVIIMTGPASSVENRRAVGGCATAGRTRPAPAGAAGSNRAPSAPGRRPAPCRTRRRRHRRRRAGAASGDSPRPT